MLHSNIGLLVSTHVVCMRDYLGGKNVKIPQYRGYSVDQRRIPIPMNWNFSLRTKKL